MTRRLAALLVAIALAAFTLRIYRLDDAPPGFYIDESAIGADAYSVATTGHDVHGTPHPVLFRALEDWKHPLYVYGAVASVRALGPTRFAVRLPAAVFGALTVLLVGLLARELTDESRVAVFAGLVLAVTPWHVQYSRMAWEAVTMGFTFVLALWLYFLARRRRSTGLYALAGAAAGLALYSYTPAKLLVPAFAATLALIEWREARWVKLIAGRALAQAASAPDPGFGFKLSAPATPVPVVAITRRQAGLLALAFALVALPMVVVQATHFREIQTRFDAVSVFHKADPTDPSARGPAELMARSYAAHLGFGFLFIAGDGETPQEPARRRQTWHGWGQLLLATAPLCAFGLWRLARRREPEDLLQLAWVFLYPLGACLTAEGVPHASRAFLAAPLAALLAAQGLAFLLDRVEGGRGRIAVLVLALGLVLANAGLALEYFFTRYSQESASAWNEGAEELIHALESRRGQLAKVHLTQGSGLVRQDVLFFARSTPAAVGPAPLDPYYEWVPATTSLPRLLGTMKKDEVLVERLDAVHQLGIAPEERFLDRSGTRGFAVYRGLQK